MAHEFYSKPSLRVSEVELTKLIDFVNIASRFQVNISLYEPANQWVWRLVFGEEPDTSMAHSVDNNIDIDLHEEHCFYIKELEILANHWECVECQQSFSHHDNYDRYITEMWCAGGHAKLVCPGEKFKRIMNTSEKVFYGGNAQFSWKACRWIERQSERCLVINKNEILVDGFDSETSTVCQFYRCKWHGCPCLETTNYRKVHRYHRTITIKNPI